MSDLNPYDTGDALQPHVWPRGMMQAREAWGAVDFDNDEGFSVARVHAQRTAAGSSVYELHVTNYDPDGAPGEGIPILSRVIVDGVQYVPAPRLCPVCGSDRLMDFSENPDDEMKYCGRCSETLYPDEIVTRRTNATRLAYARANGQPDDYEARYDTKESNA